MVLTIWSRRSDACDCRERREFRHGGGGRGGRELRGAGSGDFGSAAAAIAADPSAKSAAVAPVASAETRGAGLRIVRGRTRRFFGPPRSPFSRRKFESAKRDDDDIELFDYSIRINPKA